MPEKKASIINIGKAVMATCAVSRTMRSPIESART
jgi:hypothetical protein